MSQPERRPYAATRSAAMLTLLSVLSPLSGLAMEMALAWRFGASGTVDAFRIAGLLLAFGTQLFFGQVLPHVVVPLFSEYRAKGHEQEAWRLAFSLILILSLISLLFIGWVWLNPDRLAVLLGPGLAASGHEDDAALLMRSFSLAFLLMAWSGVASGVLYAYRVFWLSSVTQLLPNLCVVLAIVMVGSASGARALALGVLLGYVAMLVLFVYGLIIISRDTQIRLAECLKPCSREGLLKALHLSVPLLATILIGQWSVIILNRALSELPTGTLAEFGYAWKLLALINLLPAGLATVIFPAFSEAHANGNPVELSRLAMRALRLTLFLTIPLAALLFVERIPLITLMFGRGGMSTQAVAETGLLFGILLIGAPAGAFSTALSKIAFAMHDTKSAAVVTLLSALAITVLMPYAVETGGVADVVWVYTVLIWGCTLLQLGYLAVRYRVLLVGEILRYTGSLIALCAGGALPVVVMRILFELYAPVSFSFVLLEMTLSGLTFIVTVYVLSGMLGVHEASEIASYIKWQLQQITVINNLRIIGGSRDNG